MDDRLIIVSSDSHAGVPKELWEDYLPERYHELLPQLRQDNVVYPMAIYLLQASGGSEAYPEHAEAHREDFHGLHDPTLRIADMDREGVAAEVIYHGDFRQGDMFHNVSGRRYALEAWEAGAQGWNRWAADAFGFAPDRLLLTGAIGPCVDMDVTVGELKWIADHGFVGTYPPGYTRQGQIPPLFDPYWERFWSTCEDTGLAVVVHAGFGTEQGQVFEQLEYLYTQVAEAAGSTDPDAMLEHADAVPPSVGQWMHAYQEHNVETRRPLWQLLLGGVLDRHPRLKVVLSEIRVDWIPATLKHLDAAFESNRQAVLAKRKPSEYWQTNFLAGASFIHRAEVEMRDEIGVETISFGRDFPHPEGTWPNTADFLRLAFEGVPERDVELMLGENAIRFFGLDRQRLADIAKRIGPSFEDISRGAADVDPELVANLGRRGGFDKPAERETRIPTFDPTIHHDIAGMVGANQGR